jgi:hypothetical protein
MIDWSWGCGICGKVCLVDAAEAIFAQLKVASVHPLDSPEPSVALVSFQLLFNSHCVV